MPSEAKAPVERRFLAHFIDANFNDSPTDYVRLGEDLEEYSDELNPDIETKKNILGETRVVHKGYEVQGEVDPYYAYRGDPLFARLWKIANERRTGDACATTKVDILLAEDGTVESAYRENVMVVPTKVGGDTSGIQIPFEVRNNGGRCEGTFDLTTKTFTPLSDSAKLSALTLGSLTLTPTFDPDVTSYTAATSNATNTVTAMAEASGATIAIANGETTVANGGAATWTDGTNTLTITVTNGTATKTYTVTVTKSA